MMMPMRLRDLAWMRTLAELEHMTDAAASLRVPQPTLSRALARVEGELGATLFERTPTGLRTTPIGTLVVDASAEIAERYGRLLSDIRNELDPDTGVVRLAFLDSTAASLVPRLLRRFHEVAPRVRVMLTQEPGHEILEDLVGWRADLAITSVRPRGEYGWLPLYEERLVLVVPAVHPLAGRHRVRLGELAGESFVTTPVGYGYRSMTDDLLAAAGVVPEVSFESQDLATIEGLVAAGLGVAIVPEAFAGLSGTVGVGLTTRDARRRIGMTWRTDRPLPLPATRFQAMVTAEFAMPAPG